MLFVGVVVVCGYVLVVEGDMFDVFDVMFVVMSDGV